MTYAPTSQNKPEPVVGPGEFVFAASHLDHGHIYGQCNGLLEAGGELRWVHDPDPARVEAFCKAYPQAEPVDDFRRILDDGDVRLVTSAAIPNERAGVGMQVLDAGKDYFTDKAPFTTMAQLEAARAKVAETGRRYMVYYSERLHVESTWYAGELIRQGAVGRVLQVIVLAPHRLAKGNRPDWFFDKEKYGGILVDLGSHQFEQFLAFTGCGDAAINHSRVENFSHPDKPGLEDFGETSLTGDDGSSFFCRVDWYTPDGQRVWGDGRLFVVGTEGTIEARKYVDVARETSGDRLFLVDGEKEQEIPCAGEVGFPFFGQFVLDLINRTENAMTQEHAFKAAEISLRAQEVADAARAGP